MRRLKATISYDGTNFAGYQVQPKQRTVQEEIEKVLTRMHKSEATIHVTASGRTDARVHALGQVLHFDTTLTIPVDRYVTALNVQLPHDIRFLEIEEVAEDFHARYSVHGKQYRYIWSCEKILNPFRRYYTTATNGHKPDIDRMKEAAQYIIGTHDFSCFCAANTGVKDKVRTVEALDFEWHGEELHMIIRGNGFLYNMVRIIAGTLWEVGISKREPAEIERIVASMNRKTAGKTAAPQGLYLEKVQYPD